jgi:hypothetical protein
MSDIDQKIEQCEKDLAAIQENLAELREQKKREGQYQFQSGDVAQNRYGGWKIIVRTNKLQSFSDSGSSQSTGQSEFEEHGYKKITTLSDLFRCWEEHNG